MMCLRERPPALTSVLLMGKRVLVAMTRLERLSGFFASHVPMMASDLLKKGECDEDREDRRKGLTVLGLERDRNGHTFPPHRHSQCR
jgi:hypothetical protein